MWLAENYLKDLFFEADGYKTVVMSRFTYACLDDIYQLPLLEEDDALSVFCYWAFKQSSIPERGYNKNLVQRVAKECQGLPLALEVIGRSLDGESNEDCWKHAQTWLSAACFADNDDEEGVLKRLTLSIDRLDDDMKECVLDLICFSGVDEIHVDTLLDIWIYVHNLTPTEALRNLNMLEERRLLSLVNRDTGHGTAYERYVVQHGVLRKQLVYWVEKIQPESRCKRLMLDPVCNWKWCPNIEAAEIMAFSTDLIDENEWPVLFFPNAQALVVTFTGKECLLPYFLMTMLELKVLIIINGTSVCIELDEMSAFRSLTKLKSVRLVNFNVPPFRDHCQPFKGSLRKLSLCLCRGDKGKLDIEVCSKLRALEEVNIDCCVDIKELPAGMCNLTSLRKLTITNCCKLQMMPGNLGGLAQCLQKMTLYGCRALEVLPDSICELENLTFLDISKCQRLKKLPSGVGQLHNLHYLGMRGCSKIRELPESANRLTSLQWLICDRQFENQCSSLHPSIPNLKIRNVEPQDYIKCLE